MRDNGLLPVGWSPSSHQLLWWFLLLPLLAANLVTDFLIVVWAPESFALLFAVGAFSIAYGLHILGVSVTLCGLQIREADQSKFQQLRNLEYRIVTRGMLAFGGGLGIVLAASLCPFKMSYVTWVLYTACAAMLFVGVAMYVLFERRWADSARAILHGTLDKGTGISPR
jgi:hypothetical protein